VENKENQMSELPLILLGNFFGTARRQIKLIGYVFRLALVVIATAAVGRYIASGA
jgi:hypothetical protein